MNESWDHISVDRLQLSLKALGYLKRTQIYTIADLMNYTEEDLKNLDQHSAEEVITALHQHFNLTLPLNDLQ